MLNKDVSVDGNNNLVVNDTKGSTINIGMTYTEVSDLCQKLIALEVGRLTKEAADDFRRQFEAFEKKFYEKLAAMESKENIERLRKPGMQLCLCETILSSMKTDDEQTKEQLQEMLIERLNVDENTTDRAIIEDAIEKASKISKPLMALMVALQFRSYTMGPLKQALDYSFTQMGELFASLDELTYLDIAYGTQLQCLTNNAIFTTGATYEDILLANYDLYFRHAIRYGDYKVFRDAHPEIQHEVQLNNIKGFAMICIDGSKPGVEEDDQDVTIMAASSATVRNKLKKQGKEYMLLAFELLLQQMPVFTKEEMKDYLVGLNPGWASLFRVLDKFKVNNMQLSPVGNYLSLVYAKRITRLPDDFLRQLYGSVITAS